MTVQFLIRPPSALSGVLRHPTSIILEFFRAHRRLDYRDSYRKVSTSPGAVSDRAFRLHPTTNPCLRRSLMLSSVGPVEVPRHHKDGYVTFPSGSDLTVQAVATVKHVEQEGSYPTPSPPMLAALPSFLDFLRFPSPPSIGTKSVTTPAMVRFPTFSWCSMMPN